MTPPARSIDDILKDRVAAVQAIAAANTEQLRLKQKASGLLVLTMKDHRDGLESSAHEQEQTRIGAALEANGEKITRLEARVSALDAELEAAMKENG